MSKQSTKAVRSRMMKLGVLMHPAGQHLAAWRHPDGHPDGGFGLGYLQNLARIAEAAKFDFLFTADMMSLRDAPNEVIARCAQLTFSAEPMTMMASLSAVTTHIGFIVTQSTTYSYPYTVARQMASLDVLSGGRAAWNVVTSTQLNEAGNFGLEHTLDHSLRYARAQEFVEAVKGLWASRDNDLVLADKNSGILFDPARFRPYRHNGQFLTVDGVLNVPPSPQGHPVLVQAGSSGPGRDLAASIGEIVFVQSPNLEGGQEYYRDIKRRAREKGRDPNEVLVMPGFTPVIGKTRQEAEGLLTELDALIDPELSIPILSHWMHVDLSGYEIDGPLPDITDVSNKSHSSREVVREFVGDRSLTIREVAAWVASSMGHNRVIGTPEEIADAMQHWFENEACDGFLISPLIYPSGLQQFADEVIPILQERGLFRTEYEGATLRANLGLPFPD